MRMKLVILLAAGICWAQDSALLTVKRIHVEELTGGAQADRVRDMIIASLQRSGLFALTEDPDKADAILRGSADDTIFTDSFQTSDGITARAGANLGGTGSGSTSRRAGSSTISVGDRESQRIQERKHEASASVRLINREGDVIWSTTQESLGAKFRGSGADVAEKVARQLVADVERARGDMKERR
jgi:hypothetical protein